MTNPDIESGDFGTQRTGESAYTRELRAAILSQLSATDPTPREDIPAVVAKHPSAVEADVFDILDELARNGEVYEYDEGGQTVVKRV